MFPNPSHKEIILGLFELGTNLESWSYLSLDRFGVHSTMQPDESPEIKPPSCLSHKAVIGFTCYL